MEERARKGIFWERKDTYAVVGKRVFLSFVLASSLLRDEKKKARKGQGVLHMECLGWFL